MSSTASDLDMAVFQQRVAATARKRDDDEDEDEVSEARSAPPVVEHDREEISEEDEGVEEDVEPMDQEDFVIEVSSNSGYLILSSN